MHHFWTQNGPFPQMRIFFFWKTCKWALFLSFMPIYISKIKVRYLSISERSKIKEYWDLIGQEQFLAITWQPDFCQAFKFQIMLMYHKNFRFTKIPDKTNDMIFLKCPKTMFWAIFDYFWSFWSQCSKKSGSVTRYYIWAPNTMLSFRKN